LNKLNYIVKIEGSPTIEYNNFFNFVVDIKISNFYNNLFILYYRPSGVITNRVVTRLTIYYFINFMNFKVLDIGSICLVLDHNGHLEYFLIWEVNMIGSVSDSVIFIEDNHLGIYFTLAVNGFISSNSSDLWPILKFLFSNLNYSLFYLLEDYNSISNNIIKLSSSAYINPSYFIFNILHDEFLFSKFANESTPLLLEYSEPLDAFWDELDSSDEGEDSEDSFDEDL